MGVTGLGQYILGGAMIWWDDGYYFSAFSEFLKKSFSKKLCGAWISSDGCFKRLSSTRTTLLGSRCRMRTIYIFTWPWLGGCIRTFRSKWSGSVQVEGSSGLEKCPSYWEKSTRFKERATGGWGVISLHISELTAKVMNTTASTRTKSMQIMSTARRASRTRYGLLRMKWVGATCPSQPWHRL